MKKRLLYISALSGVLLLSGCNSEEEPQTDNETAGGHEDHIEEMEELHEDHMGDGHGSHEDHGEGHGEHHSESTAEEIKAEAGEETGTFNERAADGLLVSQTKNITRIEENELEDLSIAVSQTIWPSTHEENQPGTVIMVPEDHWQVALAGLNLVHHPNDGPALFTGSDSISDSVLAEIERLQPKGNEDGTEVIVMGDVDENVLDQLNGYETEHITAETPAAFAAKIDEAYAEVTGNITENIIIGSLEDEDQTLTSIAGHWIAHMEEGLLYVAENEIPSETIEALEKREGEANIYVLGSETIISEEVADQLGEYGNVERMEGESPAELSVEFAQFRDEENEFGWGIDEPGHGLTFVSTNTPELAIPGAAFAHLGKHTPLIWLEEGELGEEMYEYFSLLKPVFENDPMEGPYNHGYVLGTFEDISFQTQGIIDEKLEIEGLHGHGGH
ncbi:cell wall-binding repeat-containing protein [Thalassorhabdus alkalitolerans]|uniref:Cell wall-binding repeat-containing protein n=1 Tax=Thalassorhabdus alkalitolerans TaxID=2282697 RepID=A0ABW0YHU1_9BACI